MPFQGLNIASARPSSYGVAQDDNADSPITAQQHCYQGLYKIKVNYSLVPVEVWVLPASKLLLPLVLYLLDEMRGNMA